MAALAGVIGLLGVVILGAGAAQAQVGYPPGTTTVPAPPPTTTTVPGTTTTVPSATTTVTSPCTAGDVNAGIVAVGKTITFTLCGGYSGAPVTITVNGTSAGTKTPVNGAVTVVVTVVSQTVLQINDPINVAAVCGTNQVVTSGTGTPGASTGTFTVACTTAVAGNGGGLAFTGANILRFLLAALVLIAAGTALVLFQRRRRQTS
jgi:hypothetical protein